LRAPAREYITLPSRSAAYRDAFPDAAALPGLPLRIADAPGALAAPAPIPVTGLETATVGVVIPVWKRHARLPQVVACLRRQTLAPVRIVLVGSGDPDFGRLAAELGCVYVDHPNEPLGAKWNAGFALVRGLDYGMILGDDDLIGPDWIRSCVSLCDDETLMVGARDLYVLDSESGGLGYFSGYDPTQRRDPVGAGRLIPRAVLEAVDYAPCPPHLSRSLDAGSYHRL
jgi:glycosyltransferase involved in cell wall biosynthesis